MRSRTAPPGARATAVLAAALSLTLLRGAAPGRWAVAAPTPPPTPVPPSGSPSPFPTALHTPTQSIDAPKLTSPSAVLVDLDTRQVLYAKKANVRRPIASITKIMTALVVLEDASTGETVVVSARAAGATGSQLGLVVGERISVRHLLYAILMQSSNDAAVALAEHVAGSVPAFVDAMNRRAGELGLDHTRFQDPAGLDDRGYSTANDVARLVGEAYTHPLFARITRTKFHRIPAPSGPARRIQNRNILLWLYPGAIGAKTGFTTPAQHCLVAAADRGGSRRVVVALGSPGDDAGGAFDDGAALLNFGFEGFQKVVLVARGQSLGRVTVEGQPVDAMAGDQLERLVRKDQLTRIVRAFLSDGELTLPVVAGQRVGKTLVLIAGKRVGSVEALAARTVFRAAPTPSVSSSPGPPGVGSLAAALRLLTVLIRGLFGGFL